MSDSTVDLLAFKLISGFVDQLTQLYGNKHRPLKLYHKLLEYVKVSDTEHIAKHVSSFRHFCEVNQDAIESKDRAKLKEPVVTFSSKVFINIDYILSLADKEMQDDIWTHILTITATLFPKSRAKGLLREQRAKEAINNGTKEGDWITSMIGKVEKSFEPGSEGGVPTELFGEIFAGMSKGVEDGNLDIGKLLGSLQTICSTVGIDSGEGGLNLESMFAGLTTGDGEGIDLSNIGNIVGPMLAGLNSSPAEERPSVKVDDAALD